MIGMHLNRVTRGGTTVWLTAALIGLLGVAGCLGQIDALKQPTAQPRFRIGEKLSYTLSFNKMTGVGTAELFVASRGKLGNTVDVVELRSRARTVDLVNA